MKDEQSAGERRRFRKPLVALNLVLWPCILFLACEVVTRIGIVVEANRNSVIEKQKRKTAVFSEAYYDQLWETYGVRYRPGVFFDREVGGTRFEVRMNARGFRSDPVILPKPAGVFRIVCIGGSTTVEGRTNRTTYPALLQERLRGHFGHDRIEVVNCGISAFKSRQELERFPEYLALQPDMVIEYNAVNDVCFEVLSERWGRLESWTRTFRKSAFLVRCFGDRLEPRNVDMDELFEHYMMRNLRGLCASCRNSGVEILLCSFAYPSEGGVTEDEFAYFDHNLRGFWQQKHSSFDEYSRLIETYNRKVRELCKEHGITYVPVAENMRGGTDTFVDICHMTPAGIQQKADVIFEFLKSHLAARLKE